MPWNEAKIEKLLLTSDSAVERAIVAIYDRQTRDEKATSDTRHRNNVGFRANHASKGSYYARWINGGRKLTGHHLQNARRIVLQYKRQLTEIATSKESKSSVIMSKTLPNHRINLPLSKLDPRDFLGIPFTENAEREMQLMEAQGDREGTERDERNKFIAKSYMEGEPPRGTYAATARMLFETGFMSGDEADAWKDMMKDRDL